MEPLSPSIQELLQAAEQLTPPSPLRSSPRRQQRQDVEMAESDVFIPQTAPRSSTSTTRRGRGRGIAPPRQAPIRGRGRPRGRGVAQPVAAPRVSAAQRAAQQEAEEEEERDLPTITLQPIEVDQMWLMPAPTNLQVAQGLIIDMRRKPLIVEWNPKTINKFLVPGGTSEDQTEITHRRFRGALLGFQWVAQIANENPIQSKGYYTFRFQFPYYDRENPEQVTTDVRIYRKPTTVCKIAKQEFNRSANQRYLPKCNGYDELKYQTVTGKWKPLKNILPNTLDNGSLQVFFPIGPSKTKHLPMGWTDGWLINVKKLKETRFMERRTVQNE